MNKQNSTTGSDATQWKVGCACCAPLSLDAASAARPDAVQDVRITVKGGYTPSRITLAKGVPARLVFSREEDARCSEELLIPAFGVQVALPARAETTLEVTPTESGVFGFSCGMRMLRGEIVVA